MPRPRADQADSTIRLSVDWNDEEGSREEIKRGLLQAIRKVDEVNKARKRSRRLKSEYEVAICDRIGRTLLVLSPSGPVPNLDAFSQVASATEDATQFPDCFYIVASDAHGQKITIRVECERTITQ